MSDTNDVFGDDAGYVRATTGWADEQEQEERQKQEASEVMKVLEEIILNTPKPETPDIEQLEEALRLPDADLRVDEIKYCAYWVHRLVQAVSNSGDLRKMQSALKYTASKHGNDRNDILEVICASFPMEGWSKFVECLNGLYVYEENAFRRYAIIIVSVLLKGKIQQEGAPCSNFDNLVRAKVGDVIKRTDK